MKKEIKTKWLEALRSGEYKQARDVMRDKDKNMCCLGVLCDITKNETGGEWDAFGRFIHGDTSSPESGVIPKSLEKVLGISQTGRLKKRYKAPNLLRDDSIHLTVLNDSGLSFKQIANIIEKNF